MNTGFRARLKVILALVLGLISGCDDQAAITISPIATSTNGDGPAIFLRTSKDEKRLLILVLGGDVKYSNLKSEALDELAAKRNILAYDTETQSIMSVSGKIWPSAGPAFVDCSSSMRHGHGAPMRFDGGNKELLFGENKIDTAGKTVLRAMLSFDKAYVAVLSATGDYESSLFTGVQRASGRRYHQVFSNKDGRQIGKTYRLSQAPTKDEMEQCWAPDARWVLYWDRHFERAWVVPGVVVKE